jgi:hypothetical protein
MLHTHTSLLLPMLLPPILLLTLLLLLSLILSLQAEAARAKLQADAAATAQRVTALENAVTAETRTLHAAALRLRESIGALAQALKETDARTLQLHSSVGQLQTTQADAATGKYICICTSIYIYMYYIISLQACVVMDPLQSLSSTVYSASGSYIYVYSFIYTFMGMYICVCARQQLQNLVILSILFEKCSMLQRMCCTGCLSVSDVRIV